MAGAFVPRASMNDLAGRHWPAWAPRPCNAVLPQEAILRVRAWWESGCVPSKARCLSHSFFIVSSIFLNFRFNLSTKKNSPWRPVGPRVVRWHHHLDWAYDYYARHFTGPWSQQTIGNEKMKTWKLKCLFFCSLLYMCIYIPWNHNINFYGL